MASNRLKALIFHISLIITLSISLYGCSATAQKVKIIGSSPFIKIESVKILKDNTVVIEGTHKNLKQIEIMYAQDPNDNNYLGAPVKLTSKNKFKINWQDFKKNIKKGTYRININPMVESTEINVYLDLLNRRLEKIEYKNYKKN